MAQEIQQVVGRDGWNGVGYARWFLVFALVALWIAPGRGEETRIAVRDLRLYLTLARASRDCYEDDAEGLIATPSGCVAMVREDGQGNLLIAFRGSMLGDRDPDRKPFSNLGGKVVRRNYRDWVATNLKQTAGFLPRQYVEAAELVAEEMRRRPQVRQVFVTGHSKGGGAAEYAAIHVWLTRDAAGKTEPGLTVVTFNAAVVRERNWQRLHRQHPAASVRRLRSGMTALVTAVVMRDDPVSKIGERERSAFSRLRIIDPSRDMTPGEQHGITAVIDELERLLAASQAE